MLNQFWKLCVAALLLAGNAVAQQTALFSETNEFVSGQGGYNTCRIPSIVRTTNETLLTFCEGRKTSSSDAGNIDLVLRRSTTNGASWLPMTVVQEEGGTATTTIGNPTAPYPVGAPSSVFFQVCLCQEP